MGNNPDYVGHRKRLKERFLKSAPGTLQEYELLELILFFANSRSDTKPLAKKLLQHFGTLGKVLYADQQDLLRFSGIGEASLVVFKSMRECVTHLIKPNITTNPIISSWLALLDYCRATMAHLGTEQLRVLYLNKKQILISDELLQNGTIDQVSIYPREIAKQVLFWGASSIILVHNHPSGKAEPSVADIEMTKTLIKALDTLKVKVLDHIIITDKSHFSFKTQGVI